MIIPFQTERVKTKERVLDVHVFRRWSISVEQFVSQNPTRNEMEAFKVLSERLQVDNPVQFVAICKDPTETRFVHTHGVVGSVDAAVYPKDHDKIHLKNLRVDERVRRQGIASALIQEVIEYAFPRTVILETEDQQNLYRRHGFQLEEDGETMVLVHPEN